MAIRMEGIRILDAKGALKPGCRILDLGSSNLYLAPLPEILAFIRKYNGNITKQTEATARRLAEASMAKSGDPLFNRAFAGELFEAAGMSYMSIDIYHGYKTLILDLNRQELPNQYRGAFDLVMNRGTTEHIVNQVNSFKVIHDATAPGGAICHCVPALGFVDHGYFTYHGRFMFDLAGYNEYVLEHFWMGLSPKMEGDLFASVRAYQEVFPALKAYLAEVSAEGGSTLLNLKVPDVGMNLILRKVKDKPFVACMDISTTGGSIANGVLQTYCLPALSAT